MDFKKPNPFNLVRMNLLFVLTNTLIMMTHSQAPLPYAMNALEPYMSQETLEYHYGKHHTTYVDNLNRLIVGTPFENSPLEEIVMQAEGPLFNNAAQAWNHDLFFLSLSPRAKTVPEGALKKAIERDFGSVEAFKKQFDQAATGLFGSGWVYLAETPEGKLEIVSESNAGNPLRRGLKPLMCVDVWEHSYYIDTRNSRPEYLQNFWKLLDWNVVEQRYEIR